MAAGKRTSSANRAAVRSTVSAPGPSLNGRARRSKGGEETDQQLVDLGGPFLLDPVAGSRQHLGEAQARQGLGELGYGSRPPHRRAVPVPADEERGRRDGHVTERRHVDPVPVEVPVAVEGSGKTGVLELGDV